MAQGDHDFRHALGAGGPYVILGKYLDHRGARLAQDQCDGLEGQHDQRQDHLDAEDAVPAVGHGPIRQDHQQKDH